MSLKLNVTPGICVGGQTVRGEVELHFPQAMEDQLEEVHVKLRGSVYTRISRQAGNQRVVRHDSRQIVAENSSLWTRSPNYSSPHDEILRIPFEFQLPANVPSSCHFDAFSKNGRVGYFVELVGVRSGLLAMNRRMRIPIPVVPQDLDGGRAALALRAPGRNQAWYVGRAEKKIRRGFFGEYAKTRMDLSFPNTQMYPLFTPIPYTLCITTISKPMKKDKAESDLQKPVFPSPPTRPTDVKFRLARHVWLQAHWLIAAGSETVTALGGMETASSASESGQPVDVQVRERSWIPSEGDNNVGTWLQETTFSSAFVLTCPPTFETDIMHVKYTLDFSIAFPGMGNNLEASVPIHVSSGLTSTPPVYAPGTDQLPPHTLDLPPAYWGSADNWDEDDKSTS